MDDSQFLALHKAVFEDNVKEVRRLLKTGVPIVAHPIHGNTQLRDACQGSALRALRVLLEHGADPNERITFKSDVDGRVEGRFTPLMYASDPAVIDMLVKYGADVNAVSATGLSALMRFAGYGQAPAVAALLAHGADATLRQPRTRRHGDRSALDFCRNAFKFWESLPKDGQKPEAAAIVAGYRETLALLIAATSSKEGKCMSWISDVVVFCSLEEESAGGELLSNNLPRPIVAINDWLDKGNFGSLVRLDEHAVGGGKAFQALTFGSAFNFLPVEEFLKIVGAQRWEAPESVQVMIKNEEAPRFLLYNLCLAT